MKAFHLATLRRVVTHHRIIWWTLGVSLLLAWMGSLPARAAFGDMLDHTKAGERLISGFDLGMLIELLNAPEIPFNTLLVASIAPLVVFFVYLLFLAGGTYASLQSEQKRSSAEFFWACGAYFWRMVRLTLISLVPFALLAGVYAAFLQWSTGLEESPNERVSYYVLWGGMVVLGLLMLFVRVWFDLTQARAVALDERGMVRAALRTLRLVSFRLYGHYLAVALLRLMFTGVAIWVWVGIAPTAAIRSFLLFESIVLIHIITRLWQRAGSAWAHELASQG